MAKVGINTGSAPNAGDGSTLLAGANAINSNFTEVYDLLGDGTNLPAGIVTSIVAGNNVTVSGATGAVTINASGGGGGGSIAGINTTGTSFFNQINASGIITATEAVVGSAVTINSSGIKAGIITAATFVGSLSGNSTTANKALSVEVIDNGTNNSCFPMFAAAAATGQRSVNTNTNLSFNASTGALTATSFSGNGTSLTGIVTSIVAGTNVTVSGATGAVTINASGGGGSLQSRTTKSATTASLNAAASGDLSITAFKAYNLLKIGIDYPAWVRLYVDAASRTSDASRAEGTDPTPGSGVIAEVLTSSAGASTFLMSPGVFGWNNDGTPATTVYAKVTNKDSSARAITVTLTLIQAEA